MVERWLQLVGRMREAAGEAPGGHPDRRAEGTAERRPAPLAPAMTFRTRGTGPRAGQRWDLALHTNGYAYWLLRDPRYEYLEMQRLRPDYQTEAVAAACMLADALRDPAGPAALDLLLARLRQNGAPPGLLGQAGRVLERSGAGLPGLGALRNLAGLFAAEGALGTLEWVIWQRRRGERRWRRHRLVVHHGLVAEVRCR